MPSEKKKKRTALKEPPKSTQSEKSKIAPIEKAQKVSERKKREIRNTKKALLRAKFALQKFRDNIDAIIKIADKTNKVGNIMRVWYGFSQGSSNIIYCKNMNHWKDITVCHYLCQAPCTQFRTKRYLCTAMRCKPEKKEQCLDRNYECHAFKLGSDFTKRYIYAYSQLNELRRAEEVEQEKLRNLSQKATPRALPRASDGKAKKKRKAMSHVPDIKPRSTDDKGNEKRRKGLPEQEKE